MSMYYQNTSGVTLNSLSSVLTYTDMDLDVSIQGERCREKKEYHVATFVKQTIYNVIVLVIHIW